MPAPRLSARVKLALIAAGLAAVVAAGVWSAAAGGRPGHPPAEPAGPTGPADPPSVAPPTPSPVPTPPGGRRTVDLGPLGPDGLPVNPTGGFGLPHGLAGSAPPAASANSGRYAPLAAAYATLGWGPERCLLCDAPRTPAAKWEYSDPLGYGYCAPCNVLAAGQRVSAAKGLSGQPVTPDEEKVAGVYRDKARFAARRVAARATAGLPNVTDPPHAAAYTTAHATTMWAFLYLADNSNGWRRTIPTVARLARGGGTADERSPLARCGFTCERCLLCDRPRDTWNCCYSAPDGYGFCAECGGDADAFAAYRNNLNGVAPAVPPDTTHAAQRWAAQVEAFVAHRFPAGRAAARAAFAGWDSPAGWDRWDDNWAKVADSVASPGR